MAKAVGQHPDFTVKWSGLQDLDLDRLRHARGVYAVYEGRKLWFVSRSENFLERISRLVGALVTGRGHVAGTRMRMAGVRLKDVRIEFYLGDKPYRREWSVVQKLRPPANRDRMVRRRKPS